MSQDIHQLRVIMHVTGTPSKELLEHITNHYVLIPTSFCSILPQSFATF